MRARAKVYNEESGAIHSPYLCVRAGLPMVLNKGTMNCSTRCMILYTSGASSLPLSLNTIVQSVQFHTSGIRRKCAFFQQAELSRFASAKIRTFYDMTKSFFMTRKKASVLITQRHPPMRVYSSLAMRQKKERKLKSRSL